jgi:glucosamine--fructose-6-phosphate aminotransferase (isomerizing)
LKHGPIALVDEPRRSSFWLRYDELFEKTASNMQEVAARGGPVIMIADPEGAPRSRRRPAFAVSTRPVRLR